MSNSTTLTINYIIQPEDTIQSICTKFNTTPLKLIELNGNKPLIIKQNAEIFVPQTVPFGFTIYFIQPGETLVDVATTHGITLDELRHFNDLTDPNIGLACPLIVPEEIDTHYHLIHPYETIQDLLSRFKLTPQELIDLNEEVFLKEGQLIKIEW
ncbi:MAG: LysM peptidoglycan-binding domain-containing protein [Turicibacter sp.]